MKKTHLTLATLLFSLFMIFSFSEAQAQKPFKLAKNYQEYQKLFKDKEVRIARTKAEFVARVKEDANLKKVFDEKTLKEFTEKLKMNKNGLVTFSYEALMRKDPQNHVSAVNSILNIFGYESLDVLSAAEDYKGYYCESVGTCSDRAGSICIGQNC